MHSTRMWRRKDAKKGRTLEVRPENGAASHGRGIGTRIAQAQLNPFFLSGRDRTRSPHAAKIALATAGRIGGSDGSSRPVGELLDFTQCTSISSGDWFIRSNGTW